MIKFRCIAPPPQTGSVFCLNTILDSHFLKLSPQLLPYHLLLMTRMRNLDVQNETLRACVPHPPFHPGTR